MKIVATVFLLLCLSPNLFADGFGYDNAGALTQTVENQRYAIRSTPTSSGPLDSIKAYLNVTTEAHEVHLAVYKWSDTSFVDSTEVIDVPTGESWVWFDFIGNDSVFADTQYALVVQAEATGGGCAVAYTSGGGSTAYDVLCSYSAWPTPKWTDVFGTGSDRFSIYCYYTGEAAGAAGQIIIIQQ